MLFAEYFRHTTGVRPSPCSKDRQTFQGRHRARRWFNLRLNKLVKFLKTGAAWGKGDFLEAKQHPRHWQGPCQAENQEGVTKRYSGGDETENRDPEIRSRFEEQMVRAPPSGCCEIPPPLASLRRQAG